MSVAEEFRRISEQLRNTPWTVSCEEVSGVSTAVLVRRVPRRSGWLQNPLIGASRDTEIETRVTKNLSNDPLTGENAFRPFKVRR
ncbi:hypothetical protein [Brevibacterium litoralis]|uniref:hypothetical protein n=1 Tax=Brevibacterium litoralis TaxID=3138935 RepID=UPI0032EE0B59